MTNKFNGKLTVKEKTQHNGSVSTYNVSYGNKDFDYIEYSFVDESGKVWSWKSYNMTNLEVEKSYTVSATVKGGGLLTRCKIVK